MTPLLIFAYCLGALIFWDAVSTTLCSRRQYIRKFIAATIWPPLLIYGLMLVACNAIWRDEL